MWVRVLRSGLGPRRRISGATWRDLGDEGRGARFGGEENGPKTGVEVELRVDGFVDPGEIERIVAFWRSAVRERRFGPEDR